MSSETLPLLLLAVCVVLLILLAYNLIVSASQRRRIDRLNAIKLGPELAGGGQGDAALDRRKSVQAKLKEAEVRREKRRGYKLREELTQAGLEDVEPWQFNLAFAVAAVIGTLFSLFVLKLNILVSLILVPVVLGLGLPRFVLRYLIKRRLAEFIRLFADAIDVIVRGVKAGLPVPECIAVIGREMPDPVGKEFRLISEGTRLGMALDECMDLAVDRTPTPELRFFSIVLVVQRQTGGNLAETLGKLSDVLRGRKRMRDKVQAMSSEAKASAMIIGALPPAVCLLLSLVAPEYIGLLFTTRTGNIAIGGGLLWMGTGVLVMGRMISFEM